MAAVATLAGSKRVEHLDVEPPARHPEAAPEDLRGHRVGADSAHHRVGETRVADLAREGADRRDRRSCGVRHGQPRVASGARGSLQPLPERRILRPQPLADAVGRELAQRARDGAVGGTQARLRARRQAERLATARYRVDQAVPRSDERLDTLHLEALRDGVHVDAELRQLGEHGARAIDRQRESVLRVAVVLVRRQRRRRHGVHGVGTDEGLDVVDVGVRRVLGGRAGPERPLRPRALARQEGEVLLAELHAERQVRQLRLRDGGLSTQPLDLHAPLAAGHPRALVEQPVDLGVDAAHEEAGDRGDPVDAHARLEAARQTAHVGVRHLAIPVEREDQGDVHVDAGGDAFLDHRDAFRRGGDLHHRRWGD